LNYLIVGGSSGLGKCIAYNFAEHGIQTTLLSSDKRDTERIIEDIYLRFNIKNNYIQFDFTNYSEDVIYRELKKLKKINGIIFTIGLVSDKDSFLVDGMDEDLLKTLFDVNVLSVIRLVNTALKFLDSNSHIIGIGSVAAIKGRSKNVYYSSAKSALKTYFESLRHFSDIKNRYNVQLYTLGYMDSGSTYNMNLPLPRGKNVKLSNFIRKNLNKKSKNYTYPLYWKPIIIFLTLCPPILFKYIKV